MMFVLVTIPAFVWGQPVPDTGQTTCYNDAGGTISKCPTAPCADANTCLRTFTLPDPADGTKTISINKFYVKEGTDIYTEYAYYGFGVCYDDAGAKTACDPIACIKKGETEPSDCPSICYRDNKGSNTSEVSCPASNERGKNDADFYGQDANYSINPRSTSSFTPLNDAGNADTTTWIMIRDNITGLLWLKKDAGAPSTAAPNNSENTYTLTDASGSFITLVNTLKFGGFANWRLPTVKELSSILDASRSAPAANSDSRTGGYFANMQSGHYWTSTASGASDAYYVDFDSGAVGIEGKDTENYVIAVRKAD